jgi:hypothetical protein
MLLLQWADFLLVKQVSFIMVTRTKLLNSTMVIWINMLDSTMTIINSETSTTELNGPHCTELGRLQI